MNLGARRISFSMASRGRKTHYKDNQIISFTNLRSKRQSTTLTELQLKINFISCYENISTNPISWMASPVIHFTATIGTYKEIAKPLTHATTLPLKHGKFISSSLISSLTTLQKRSKLSWTKRYQLQSRKPSEKFGWNAWDLRQNSPAMTRRGSLEITENWLYKKRLCTVVAIHSESRNMLTASELSHSMASKQNKTDLKTLDRRTRQVGVFLNKCISKTIYTDT